VSDAHPTGLRARIEAFLAADQSREITEDGDLLFALRDTSFRLEEAHGSLLLHLWSAERNWLRRVVRVAGETQDRLELDVERFGQSKPGRLVVAAPRRRQARQSDRAAARRKYSAWLRRLLEREFPRAQVEALSTAPDLKRSFSSLYTRARLGDGRRWWAVMGVSAGEGAGAADGLLTYALLWLDWNRRHYASRTWAGLRLFLPGEQVWMTACRLAFLSPVHAATELYAVNEEEFTCTRVDERDIGNLDTHLTPASREAEIVAAESSAVERIRTLAPDGIEAVPLPGRNELALRFRGLQFARSSGGQVSFGVGPKRRNLTPKSLDQLEVLVERLKRERRPEGRRSSRYYRLQAERWLESLVRASPRAIDPRLRRGPLYRQVPALAAGERGVVDLLGVTRDGGLGVIELKASTDIQLLMQGLDYWIRVRGHHQRGELSASGYFPGVQLRPDPPQLLLVAPGLQFHPATELCAAYLLPEVPVTLVGLAEDWRRELKVIFRRTVTKPSR
jgi:hypothetical protein